MRLVARRFAQCDLRWMLSHRMIEQIAIELVVEVQRAIGHEANRTAIVMPTTRVCARRRRWLVGPATRSSCGDSIVASGTNVPNATATGGGMNRVNDPHRCRLPKS